MKITQRELNRYRNQISQRKSDASAYLRARMAKETKGLSIADARNKTIEIMQDCLAVFGDQAQALSAELFDEICEAEGLDAVSQIFDDVIDEEKMTEKVRYYAGKLKDGDWDGYAGLAADLAAYYVHKSALENLFRNCDLNNIRFARVGTGRETCGFCFMLCSRGFVYANEDSAARASHPHCDCIIVPGQKGKTHIEGYEPEEMQKRWAACWDTLGGDKQLRQDWDTLTATEKAKYKGKKEQEKWLKYRNKRIQRECETRNNAWLYRGRVPKLEYEDELVLKKKMATRTARENHELEKKTAEKLRGLGFDTVFVDDEKHIKGVGSVGLADLKNGIEIKTVFEASSPNTINRHISNCKRKEGIKRIVVNVSENKNLSDETARRYISNAIWRHGQNEAYLLDHNGKLTRVLPEPPHK